ncbi:serine/threonine-protein kinase [Terrabacter sp. MAHUQ-38]|uniref:serine/threonine-protein kinase n=1 Tax=unclassified Terrabacter TaxID=2630222 RepID=UPI00165DF97C|nr:serine/threonine protein kinase [Terrabacter sp. MAHUQ-38]
MIDEQHRKHGPDGVDESRTSDVVERPDVPGHRLDTILGRGGSAVVWSGVDATGRRVAVKIPHRCRGDVDARQALVEQQVLMAVQHDHLVRLRAVVPLDDGRDALVFDLVRGAVLRAMVGSRGHMRPGEVVTVLTPVCEAVAHLHSAGGLHGDISPSNITVTATGRPVLLDLGAARVAGHEPGDVHGTSGFVAPEVRLGSEPGEAADVYALGAVAWFCATGNGAPDTMMRLDPETVLSHVGPELADVVAACIDPEPERRPSAAELARRFYEAASAEPIEVVLGADEASALTHRLRAQASREVPGPAHVPRRGWRRLGGWTLGRLRGRRLRWPSRWPSRWPRRLATAMLFAIPVLAAAGWALAARAPDGPPAGLEQPSTSRPVTPGRAAAPTARIPTHRSTAEPGPVDRLLRDPASPSAHPEEILQVLSDRRCAVLVARDASALDDVHAPRSPSAASDRALVARLVESQVRWTGLRLEVAESAFVSGTSTKAVLRARVDWTAYAVVWSDGTRVARPPDSGRLLDFSLARDARGWRIASISDAPAT